MKLRCLISLILLSIMATSPPSGEGIKVITTFGYLASDVSLLACDGDEVYSLIPQGVDPHDYQLNPRDVELLKRADIIISTGHTPIEREIKEMVSKGEVKSRLIEIPNLDGIKILKNPMTGKENLHGVTLDPRNYLVFMNSTKEIMKEINPRCSKEYERNFEKVRAEVEEILSRVGEVSGEVIGSSPVTQYYLEWSGLSVKWLLVREHGVPPTTRDLLEIERVLSEGKVSAIAAVRGDSSYQKSLELSEKYGVPIILLPSPIEDESSLDRIRIVSKEISKIGMETKDKRGERNVPFSSPLVVMFAILLSSAVLGGRKFLLH